ncbi:DAK2 domain-containing protein [Anaerolineae bacterium CFX7]|nr:DAK2 domain-containing protein [Anaerolineae bacterium CFX7]
MTERSPFKELDGNDLKRIFGAGTVWLERNAPFINSLNVFPVPDGDTGTNMLLTMQTAMRQANANHSPNAGEISAAISHGALLGARGNSGVILSQILRGMARGMDKREKIDATLFAEALGEGARTAYKGVVKPVEGTILTVIREAADRAVLAAAQSDDVGYVLEKTVAAARSAVVRTPQLLPVLKEAGVVDAGGEGLAIFLEGALKFLNGENLEIETIHGGAQNLEHITREEGWGYDIQFHIHGSALAVEQIRETISAMGESALIVGDETLIKVHVHAPNPGDIIKYGAEQGALVNIIIENMQAQYVDFMAGHTADERVGAENLGAILPHAKIQISPATEIQTGIATIAVAPGAGLREIFESIGISAMVNGGPTMNPSAQDLLDAIERVAATEIILLPNDKNIILAANQAKELTSKRVHVIPTRTAPQGLAALLAFNYQADVETNLQIMSAAAKRLRTVEITRAVRAARVNNVPINEGQPIALLDGELIRAQDDLAALTMAALRDAGAADNEIITLYYGADVDMASAEQMRALAQREYPAQDIELHSGGQPLYPYIISIE